MLLPLGWVVCVSLVVPGLNPAPSRSSAGSDLPVLADSAEVAEKVDTYFRQAAVGLPPGPRDVLRRMPNRERRLLAVAHYVQRRDQVDTLWTWTEQEAHAHRESGAYSRAMAELTRVRRSFARLNPGYVLVTDTNPRPLEIQLRYWNREPSVLAAARELRDSAGAWLAVETFPVFPDSTGLARFVGRLQTYRPTQLPTVAVPGLSLHGQLRAFDFAILRQGRVVASTRSATMDSVWDRGGWSERLRSAITEAGGAFRGPLDQPREPWHYEHRVETP